MAKKNAKRCGSQAAKLASVVITLSLQTVPQQHALYIAVLSRKLTLVSFTCWDLFLRVFRTVYSHQKRPALRAIADSQSIRMCPPKEGREQTLKRLLW